MSDGTTTSGMQNAATTGDQKPPVLHTPGPWRHDTRGNFGNAIEAYSGGKFYEFDDGWRTVAMVQECCASDKYADQEANKAANIRLIAAAPEMLAALELAEPFLRRFGSSDEAAAVETVLAAIRKAKGAA